MIRKTKRDWIDAGVHILMIDGFSGMTIAALLKKMGMTKGSFYHHFAGIDDFIERFLEHFEQEGTMDIIKICDEESTPEARLLKLIKISTRFPAKGAVAMRVWAEQDDRVRAVQERTDANRLAYLESQFRPITNDPALARSLANLMYSILIGSQHTVPPISGDEQRKLFYTALAPWGIAPEKLEQNNDS